MGSVAYATHGATQRALSSAVLQGGLGFLAFLALWEVIGRAEVFTAAWPPVSDVVRELVDPANTDRWLRTVGSTVSSARLGAAIGIAAAAVLGVAAALLPATRRAAERHGVRLYEPRPGKEGC